MASLHPPADEEPPAPEGDELLVPLLGVEQALADPVALATWHEALSDAIASHVPHDLLALWLYPSEGGAVLLGPEALKEDDLVVPLPGPRLEQRHIEVVEEMVRDAGYGSAVCLPVRFGGRDVGLLLIADLRRDRYHEAGQVQLTSAARKLAPTLGRMARQWRAVQGGPLTGEQRTAALLEALATAAAHAGTAREFGAALSRALDPLVPHDQLELLVAHPSGSGHYRLTEQAGGPPSASSLVLPVELLDPAALLDAEGRVLLPDASRHPRWPRGYFVAAEPVGAELRAVTGARFTGPAGLTGYLLVGSVGPELYEPEDAELLARVGALIAVQVAALAHGWGEAAGEAREGRTEGLLLGLAEALATTIEPAEATRRLREIATRFLPFDELRLALRLTEGDRVVLLAPGERRPLADLPRVPVAGTTLGRVLEAELPGAFELVGGEARLVVPLRVAGRVHGALVLTAAPPALLNPAHTRAAQRLADVVAPHLELLRREAVPKAP